MQRHRNFLFATFAALFLLLAGCSAEGDSGGQGGSVAGRGGTGGTGGAAAKDSGVAGSGGVSGSGGSAATGGSGGSTDPIVPDPEDPENCTGITETAEPATLAKVDIIWVIDSSGSMWDEAQRVATNINAFATDIGSASIDYRVVILTTVDLVTAGTPLATSGNYLFVAANVDSQNSLAILRDLYGQYSSFLRPDAVTHFVILTDDESDFNLLLTPAERANAFRNEMQGLLGKSFYAHAIASEDAGGGAACMPSDPAACPFGMTIPGMCGASAPGFTYYELAKLTSALTVSVCIADWSEVFGPLKEAVIESAPLPCNYAIPAPPDNKKLDAAKVNVQYLPAEGGEQLFPRADGLEACAGHLAWYYDDPDAPQEVLLCEDACKMVAAGGTINITFGCETVLLE